MPDRINKILAILKKATSGMTPPMSLTLVNEFGLDPFIILISCLLSLRARDTVTIWVCRELFAQARTPQEILEIPIPILEKLFYKLGFYRKKARLIHEVCLVLLEKFNGIVPSTEEQLLSIKGVGHKTAALVLGEGFGIPAICVDTHVHKVSNRLGLVATKTPEATEKALKLIVPQEYWIELNRLFVMWGQNICVPISPWCSRCPLFNLCPKIGVTRSR